MSDFQCKFYLLDSAETLECKEGNAEYSVKIADRPFPDSLLSFVYYDINSWEPRFHEAERSLMAFYQTRDTTCLKPVQKLLDDFKDGHPYFFYLWLDWSNRLKQATPDCKNPTRLLPHKELAHVPSNLATMQQQILRLFQTVLDASITDVGFSIRVQAYEQAPSLQKFDFQPMKISFEFVDEKQFAEVLYPQSMYDLIDFSLRKCVQEKIMMRPCKNCGKYFALTVHGSTEYCSRVFDSRGRTCKEVGAMRQYVQSHAQDELLKIYRREYKRRFAWIRAGKISQEAFSAWSKEAQKEKEKCETGKISKDEFTQWLYRKYPIRRE